jgi:hypothetical protein
MTADNDDSTTETSKTTSGPQEPHACEIRVTFPTNLQAEQSLQILQVDKEPTDRVTKSYRLETKTNEQEEVISMIV